MDTLSETPVKLLPMLARLPMSSKDTGTTINIWVTAAVRCCPFIVFWESRHVTAIYDWNRWHCLCSNPEIRHSHQCSELTNILTCSTTEQGPVVCVNVSHMVNRYCWGPRHNHMLSKFARQRVDNKQDSTVSTILAITWLNSMWNIICHAHHLPSFISFFHVFSAQTLPFSNLWDV